MERVMIAQGNTAEIYQYEEGKILKLFRKGMPAFPIEKEYRIACIVQEHLPNVPKVYELANVDGRMGIIYEQIEGSDMIKDFLGKPFSIKRNSRHLAQIHAAMHQEDVEVEDTVKEKLSRDINNGKELTTEEKAQVLRYLDGLPDGKKLCHFDYHPGNLIIRGQEPIIIDWMTACYGAPAGDVARTCLLMQHAEMMHTPLILRLVMKPIMKKIGREYEKEYCRLTGMTHEEIAEWTMPIAAARLAEWLTDHERKVLVEIVRKGLQ